MMYNSPYTPRSLFLIRCLLYVMFRVVVVVIFDKHNTKKYIYIHIYSSKSLMPEEDLTFFEPRLVRFVSCCWWLLPPLLRFVESMGWWISAVTFLALSFAWLRDIRFNSPRLLLVVVVLSTGSVAPDDVVVSVVGLFILPLVFGLQFSTSTISSSSSSLLPCHCNWLGGCCCGGPRRRDGG